MALPRFILLKSIRNNKYLRYRKEEDSDHASLQFSQDEEEKNAEIQYLKFEVQESKLGQGFVHIRSCYNNKYWVRKSAESKCIAALANEREEDQSKWSCTLFKIEFEVEEEVPGKPQKARLVHSDQMAQHACVLRSSSVDLEVDDEDSTQKEYDGDVFLAYNVSNTFVFPDRIAFIGQNKQYGAVTTVGGVSYLEFKTSDMGHQGVVHDWDLVQPDGHVLIKNRSFRLQTEMWWRENRTSSPLIVMGDPRLPSGTYVTLWTPINLGGNRVALRYEALPLRYANCVSAQGMDQVLGVSATTLNDYTLLQVVEPVRLRQVNNMVYNLDDSRVYDVSSIEKFRDDRSNNTSVEQTGTFRVAYTVSQTMTWSDSVSMTDRIAASMSVSVPYVGVDFGVEVSQERQHTVEWGKEDTDEREVSYEQNVTIPPRKRIVMVVLATQAQCDVPFTCRVHDVVSDGEIRNYTKRDGLFRGANEFNFVTQLTELDL